MDVPRERRSAVLGIAALLSLAIFGLYLGRYPLRHANVPAGFDAPWYVWRAQYVAARGIGPLGTASRPGHAVLSALLGSVTGLSQLRMSIVFAQLLPALLALGVGAFAYVAIRPDRAVWALTVGLTGTAVGATRLVGENVANLLNLALTVAALVVVVSARARPPAMLGAALLLVAAGLAHWVFLAISGAALAIAVVLRAAAIRRAPDETRASIAGDIRSLAIVGVGAALTIVVLIAVVLRAPFSTVEVGPNPLESTAKLITDLARLWPACLIAVLGIVAIAGLARAERGLDQGTPRALLVAWAIVAAGGVLAGVVGTRVTTLSSLPPHRFLALLVAFPGMVSAGAAVWWASRRAARRVSLRAGPLAARLTAALVVVVAAGVLLLPTLVRWYRYPILMSSAELQQAKTAADYVDQLPARQPFIVVVGPGGAAGRYTAILNERVIRMELPPDRQAGLRVFPGNPADLLAGRRTVTGDPRTDQVTLPYWQGLVAVLPEQPPILLMRDLGGLQFEQASVLGSVAIAPGVALLRGPPPTRPLAEAPAPDASVTVATVLKGVALLALLWGGGVGWTRAVFGVGAPAEVWVSLSPIIGMGALLLGGFLATEAGLRMLGVGGPAVYAVVTLSGWAAGWTGVPRRLG